MTKQVKRSKNHVPASTRGEYPGEYKKTALVEVPMPVPSRAALEAQRDEFGELGETSFGRQPHERYIVDTRRLDGRWTVVVEFKGNEWPLPHKVVEQIRRHCDSIIKAQRSDRAREAAQQRMQAGIVPFQQRQGA